VPKWRQKFKAFLLEVNVTVREVIKLIEADGWYLARQRSSHRQFKHPAKAGLVTVAGHPPKVLTRQLSLACGVKVVLTLRVRKKDLYLYQGAVTGLSADSSRGA